MLQCLMQGIQANVGALINDTVGVLAAVRYIDGTDTIASVIMGTGKQSQHPSGIKYNRTLNPACFAWEVFAKMTVSHQTTCIRLEGGEADAVNCRNQCVLHGAIGKHHQVAASLQTAHTRHGGQH